MNLDDLDLSRPFSATVTHTERITPEGTDEVRHIHLAIRDPSFTFVDGQSLAVLAPGPREYGTPPHARLYSIAGGRQDEGAGVTEVALCVRRCHYVDESSGQSRKGIVSNYLCDAQPGDTISVAGPYGRPFLPPRDKTCNLLMIGVGTGMGPFRAFLKHIYEEQRGWEGTVRLYYGARTGLDLLYQNEIRDDVAQYYRQETFKVYQALSARPDLYAPPELDETLHQNIDEFWDLLQDRKTHVYVAGLNEVARMLDETLARKAGSMEAWLQFKHSLIRERRWSQILYD